MNDLNWLQSLVATTGASSGSLHREKDGDLELSAQVNIPPPVVERVRSVPRGKGMAGLAQVRGEPIQSCNIQTDDSGQIKPMARLVEARAAIALPVMDAERQVRAVVGLAFADEGELSPRRQRELMAAAADLP